MYAKHSVKKNIIPLEQMVQVFPFACCSNSRFYREIQIIGTILYVGVRSAKDGVDRRWQIYLMIGSLIDWRLLI